MRPGDSALKRNAGKTYRKHNTNTEEPEQGQRRTISLQGSGVGDKRMHPDGSNPHVACAARDWWEEAVLFLLSAKLLLLLYPRHRNQHMAC